MMYEKYLLLLKINDDIYESPRSLRRIPPFILHECLYIYQSITFILHEGDDDKK